MIKKIKINFSSEILSRVNELGLQKYDIENRVRNKYGDTLLPPKKTDFFFNYKPCKAWQQYLIIGNAKQRGTTGYIIITDIVEKVGSIIIPNIMKLSAKDRKKNSYEIMKRRSEHLIRIFQHIDYQEMKRKSRREFILRILGL